MNASFNQVNVTEVRVLFRDLMVRNFLCTFPCFSAAIPLQLPLQIPLPLPCIRPHARPTKVLITQDFTLVPRQCSEAKDKKIPLQRGIYRSVIWPFSVCGR